MINLLPPQYKQELQKEENWRIVLILGILFLVFLISLSLILFSIKTYIQGQVEFLRVLIDLQEKTFENPETKLLREKITLANQNFLKLKSFYQNKINLTEILEKISQSLPSETYLTLFSWQKTTSRVSIAGFAKNREALFKLKENLEKEKEFSEIYFPPSNWLKAVDIEFQAIFKYEPK